MFLLGQSHSAVRFQSRCLCEFAFQCSVYVCSILQVWATDLDFSDQLSMTQLMLLMTRGRLDCRSSQLEVPPPARDVKQPGRLREEAATPPTVTSHCAVMRTQLRHTNLAMVHYSVFFQMCKAQGVGFDVKERQGTLFISTTATKDTAWG
ncbi:IQ motif-containing protein H-like isoform X3 [Polyodon spathula]|uniref:IQ motif-containing protein H-like isoform X3 n=1 Tax=Polyodon spathula TaxID=7913 RepID=UPI001B7E0091|nr:IQ motif-containing protein H-like isoform X3 [Polyodon spathula]